MWLKICEAVLHRPNYHHQHQHHSSREAQAPARRKKHETSWCNRAIMTGVSVDVQYLSVGANRQTAAGDWSADGTVAFGADTNIALWRPNVRPTCFDLSPLSLCLTKWPLTHESQDSTPRGIRRLLRGHKELIKAVRFLPATPGQGEAAASYLLSAGDDKCVKLWRLDENGTDSTVSCVQTVEDHTAPVNCIATLKTRGPTTGTIFATGAADASIKIWQRDGEALRMLQTIKTNPRYFPLTVAISPLGDDGNTYILASAGTKDIIQIYTGTVNEDGVCSFALSATLTGHEGWIRSLDFTLEDADSPTSDLLLASASQDKYIRLWRIHRGKDLPAQAATASDPTVGAYLPGKSPSNKAYRFQTPSGADYSVTFESLLFNHDDWIYSAKWHAKKNDQGKTHLQLLSTSADNSLALWESDPDSGIWVTTARLGEISREKGATTATGSIGGFWTGLWAPSGASILTLGRTGSWRRWDWDATHMAWAQQLSVSGHVRPVTGISWAPRGEYLLSTSADQTTRLHSRWAASSSPHGTWHEMARPQIHGYDLNCVDVLSATRFVSGADEKLMRVFSMPRAVARMLQTVTGQPMVDNAHTGDSTSTSVMPDAANMPVLGLSNKATVEQPDDAVIESSAAAVNPETNRDAVDPATVVRRSTLDTTQPPFEESLSRYTLWPEIEKLYGHGYEISCLAASHDGRLIASACKASSLNHAVIRIFETERWTELRPPLAVHTLTATRLRFSADDQYLLSVGRDRQWALFERRDGAGRGEDRQDVKEGEMPYARRQNNAKGHTRMILDCAWAPPTTTEDARSVVFFATAGRDKAVKLWVQNDQGSFVASPPVKDEEPVTAVDILGTSSGTHNFVMATGNERGEIKICTLSLAGGDPQVAVNQVMTIQPEYVNISPFFPLKTHVLTPSHFTSDSRLPKPCSSWHGGRLITKKRIQTDTSSP